MEYLNRSNDFYVPSLCFEEVGGGGGQHTVITPRPHQRTNNEQILQYENLTLMRMTKDEKVLAIFKGLLL